MPLTWPPGRAGQRPYLPARLPARRRLRPAARRWRRRRRRGARWFSAGLDEGRRGAQARTACGCGQVTSGGLPSWHKLADSERSRRTAPSRAAVTRTAARRAERCSARAAATEAGDNALVGWAGSATRFSTGSAMVLLAQRRRHGVTERALVQHIGYAAFVGRAGSAGAHRRFSAPAGYRDTCCTRDMAH